MAGRSERIGKGLDDEGLKVLDGRRVGDRRRMRDCADSTGCGGRRVLAECQGWHEACGSE